MSGTHSPCSEKMDISDTSDLSENFDDVQVLRLSNPISTNETLDNESLDNTLNDNSVLSNKNSKLSTTATDFHPLMVCPLSPISPDFPDLIPEKAKLKHVHHDIYFVPQSNSSSEIKLQQDSVRSCNAENSPTGDEYADVYSEFQNKSPAKKVIPFDFHIDISQDILSDNENDKSVYEAHLSSNLQNVSLTMNEKEGNLNFLAHNKRSNKLRKVKVLELPTNNSDESDVSSLDSNLDSLKSEDVYNGIGDEMADEDKLENSSPVEPIEPLSAVEERRHARHWQRMVIPGGGGEQRTIDMRVIEPYKRVLSHGGYLRAGGHTAIVLFSACYLPDRSRVDYDYVMDNLFLYVLWTLERLVTEDYVLVYLHGAATKLPSFSWLKRCYQMVGRKLRKNLSHLYIVHPTLWIKTMLFMAKPFISSKFYRKITFVATLRELMVRVPLEAAAIPDKVKAYDSLHFSS